MRILLDTHGCRLNQSETDAMAHALRVAGHEIVDELAAADAYLLNTCTITNAADGEARRALRRVRRANPALRVLATGCLANRVGGPLGPLADAQQVFGNREKDEVVAFLADDAPSVAVESLRRRRGDARLDTWALEPAQDPGRARAFLKIQDGCDYACSFCIVPEVRGANRSLAVATVERQFRALVAAGRPEVVLTGAHLGTYGRDLAPPIDLARLLVHLLRVSAATRIRLGSVDPHEVREPLLRAFEAHPDRLCRHLHVAMQSGSEAVLRRMRRAHDPSTAARLLSQLRGRLPDLALGGDLIVGFPGETEEDFAASCRLLAGDGLDYAHVFTYSPREGTTAALMEDVVDGDTKRRRSRELRALASARWTRFLAQQCGSRRAAVTLRVRDRGSGMLQAITDNYVRVLFEGPGELLGRAVLVALDDPEGDHVRGRLCA